MVPTGRGRPHKKHKSEVVRKGLAPTVKAKMGLGAGKIPVGKNILITDDESALRELLAAQLQEKGYKCVSLASKADAYQYSIQNKPDLIITDINSPGMDGFQFVRLLKSNTATVQVPVVFLTGVASDAIAQEARRLGADEYVTKPCTLADVQAVVEKLIGDKGKPRRSI